jgi:hypothetical protein
MRVCLETFGKHFADKRKSRQLLTEPLVQILSEPALLALAVF